MAENNVKTAREGGNSKTQNEKGLLKPVNFDSLHSHCRHSAAFIDMTVQGDDLPLSQTGSSLKSHRQCWNTVLSKTLKNFKHEDNFF